MTPTKTRVRTAFAIAALIALQLGEGSAVRAEEQVSYKLDVQPILNAHCGQCHNPGGQGYQQSGLDLSSYEGLMAGTKYGAIVVPGEPLTSNLMVLVEGRADPSIRMPHHQRPLLKQQQSILREWVKQGAKNN